MKKILLILLVLLLCFMLVVPAFAEGEPSAEISGLMDILSTAAYCYRSVMFETFPGIELGNNPLDVLVRQLEKNGLIVCEEADSPLLKDNPDAAVIPAETVRQIF